jgi:acyl-CoA thioester hydrolase
MTGAPDIDGYFVTGMGVVHPWLCDAMGHLTTRHYTGFFDDASYHLFAALGYDEALGRSQGWGWADVVTTTNYHAEVVSGALILVKSRIAAIGNSSMTAEHLLCDRTTGVLSARMEARTVCFDLVERRSRPVPDAIRATVLEMTAARPIAAQG